MSDNGRPRATEQGGHNSMRLDLINTIKHRTATNEPPLGLANRGLSSHLQRSRNSHGKYLIVGRATIKRPSLFGAASEVVVVVVAKGRALRDEGEDDVDAVVEVSR